MKRRLLDFIKREQQPLLIVVLLVSGLAYPCRFFFESILKGSHNHQEFSFTGTDGMPCQIFIRPTGQVIAGRDASLLISESVAPCALLPTLPPAQLVNITKTDGNDYEVRFHAVKGGTLNFTFGGQTPARGFNYQYKTDPSPWLTILFEISCLTAFATFLVTLGKRSIDKSKAHRPTPSEASEMISQIAELKENKPFAPSPEWLEPVVEALARYAKLIAGATATFYVIGLFVVNAYLSQWGASDYSLIKPRALLAGLWFLFFLGLCTLPMRLFFAKALTQTSISPANDGSAWFLVVQVIKGIGRFLLFGFALCFSSIPLIVILGFVFSDKTGHGALDGEQTVHILGVILGAQFFGLLVSEGVVQLARRFVRDEITLRDAGQAVISALTLVIFVFSFAFVFARTVYSKIPDSFGGGGSHQELMTFKDLDDQSAKLLNPQTCGVLEDGEYEVPFSGDNYILISCPNLKSVFRLDRKYVVAESWR